MIDIPDAPEPGGEMTYLGSLNFPLDYSAWIDPWIGTIIGWNPPSYGGGELLGFRITVWFDGSCYVDDGYMTIQVPTLEVGQTTTGPGCSLKRNADGYEALLSKPVGTCPATSTSMFYSFDIEAYNSAGYSGADFSLYHTVYPESPL